MPDGYNIGTSTLLDIGYRERLRNGIGRDLLVSGAVGKTSYGGVKYNTVAKNLTGLLAPGFSG